jgi:ABC-type antimicrobial peptide transport system permease subunit
MKPWLAAFGRRIRAVRTPVGQSLLVGGVNLQPVQIVGIVAAVHQSLEDTIWPESVYIAFAQNPLPYAMLAIRTEGDPLRLTPMVREQVRALDRDQPIADVRTMDDLVDQEVGQRRLIVRLLGSFAGVALLLALTGIYGVISYSVTQRVHELGIRWALGARRADILRLVMGQGLGLTLAGIAIGIGLLFVLVALAATYIPAHRATRIDPIAAVRVSPSRG